MKDEDIIMLSRECWAEVMEKLGRLNRWTVDKPYAHFTLYTVEGRRLVFRIELPTE